MCQDVNSVSKTISKDHWLATIKEEQALFQANITKTNSKTQLKPDQWLAKLDKWQLTMTISLKKKSSYLVSRVRAKLKLFLKW